MSDRDRMELADILDRADDKIQHGMGFGGYDPNGLPFWLADAILTSDWLAARDASIREEALRPVRALLDRVEHENFYAVPPLNHTSTKTIAIGIDRVRAVLDTPAQADGTVET